MRKLLLMTGILLAAACSGRADGKRIWAKSFLGKPAPKLVVEKWMTPQPETRGKFVLIDFWATWCPPCRETIPEINRFQRKFGDRLVCIGVTDDSEKSVRKWSGPKIEYAIGIDTRARTKNELQISSLPHVLIVDPQGIVRWEGSPVLKGYELTDDVIAGIIKQYG